MKFNQYKPLINIELIHADWDKENGPCAPCDIGVDELGNFQCTDCLSLFPKAAENRVIKALEQEYGESWAMRYKELKEVQRAVERKDWDLLIQRHYAYGDNSGTIKTNRCFYEKRL